MPAAAEQPTLYRASYLLPIAAPPLEDGGVLVVGGHVRAVGPARQLAADHPCAAVVDFGKAVLLPPFANAHTHLELSDFPDWAVAAGEPDAPGEFVDWILRLVRVRRKVDAGQLRAALAGGLAASLRAGTGAVGDILTTLDAAPAYRGTPLRGRVFAEVLGRESTAVAARLAEIAAQLPVAPAAGLGWGLSPHAPYTLSASTLDEVFAFAGCHALPCCIHLAESAAESEFLADGSGAIAESLYAAARWDPAAEPAPGCSPVEAVCRPGRLGEGGLAVHGVQVDADDIARLKARGCHIVLCPRSNAALGTGRAPVAAYLAAGVPLALGTDSLASAPSLSLWDELAFARSWFAGQAAPRDWLRMATLGGARALGLGAGAGTLAAGGDASFQVVTLPQAPLLRELEEALCSAGAAARTTHLYLSARNVLPAG